MTFRSVFTGIATVAVLIAASVSPTVGQDKKSKPKVAAKKSPYLGSLEALAFTVDGQLVQSNTIGVTVAPTDPVLRAHLKLTKGHHGVVVTRVLPNSRAAKAGVRAYDILLSINGKSVSNAGHVSGGVRSAKKKAIRLKLIRAARHFDLTIRPAPPKKTHVELFVADSILYANSGWKYKIGVHTQPADPSLIAQLVLPPSTGLVIRSVEPKGPAAKAGIQKHDVILKAGDKYLSKDDDLRRAIDKAAGKPLTLEFLRAGRKQTCTVTPKKRPNQILSSFMTIERPLLWKIQTDVVRANPLVLNVQTGRRVQWLNTQLRPLATGVTDVKTQLRQMSRQLAELRKSMDRLQKTVAAGAKKNK